MLYRTLLAGVAAAIIGISCLSTEADARRGGGGGFRGGGFHGGAGMRGGGMRVGGVHRGGAYRGGAYRGAYRGGVYRGAYRGAYVGRGVALGAAAAGAGYYYNNRCGYYPYPPCY